MLDEPKRPRDPFWHFYDPLRPFSIPQMIYQGRGCIQRIPEILKLEGWKRAMLVIDPGVLKTSAGKLFESMLNESGIEFCTFSEIQPNPREKDIEEKGIAIGANTNRTLKEIAGDLISIGPHTPLPYKTYPIIAVPTTAGTGSEVIRNAVFTDPDGYKRVLIHDSILPRYAFCDPALLATLPPRVAASSGMDALVQAIEAYVSLAANDFSETMSLRAIELIGPNIVPYYHNRAIPEYADAMSKGCVYQGIAWNNSFIAQIHACNHPITEILNVSHGEACAILLPWFVEWNGVVCKEKFRKVHNLMFPDNPLPKETFKPRMLAEKKSSILIVNLIYWTAKH